MRMFTAGRLQNADFLTVFSWHFHYREVTNHKQANQSVILANLSDIQAGRSAIEATRSAAFHSD